MSLPSSPAHINWKIVLCLLYKEYKNAKLRNFKKPSLNLDVVSYIQLKIKTSFLITSNGYFEQNMWSDWPNYN